MLKSITDNIGAVAVILGIVCTTLCIITVVVCNTVASVIESTNEDKFDDEDGCI